MPLIDFLNPANALINRIKNAAVHKKPDGAQNPALNGFKPDTKNLAPLEKDTLEVLHIDKRSGQFVFDKILPLKPESPAVRLWGKEKAEEYIGNSIPFSLYNSACSSDKKQPFIKYVQARTKSYGGDENAQKLVADEIKGVCEEVYKKAEENNITGVQVSYLIKNLTDLYCYDREKYDYVINSPALISLSDSMFSAALLSRCNMAQIKLVESNGLLKPEDKETVMGYVRSSDIFCIYPPNVEKLHKILSRFTVGEDTTVYRGDIGVGMFEDTALLDKKIEKKVRLANIKQQDKTKEVRFSGFGKFYSSYEDDSLAEFCSLYDYINDCERISLADAMIMMPYLDEDTQQKVLGEIKNTVLADDRFKSVTLRKGFAEDWVSKKDIACVVSTINLKKGTHGLFISSNNWINGQYEFVVNNVPKITIVNDVKYDKDKNIFYLSSDMGEVR